MKAIETSGLTKFYGRARGITDVSLAVEEGEFFGFIGPNGAGKSTTIRTLLGLIHKTGGSAKLLGISQSAVSHQLRSLKAAKLVRFRREGKTVFYSLDDDHVRSVLSLGMEHILEK